MRTLIFDIETVGEAWEDLDETTQHQLCKGIERSATEPNERALQLENVRSSLGLSPLTGQIVVIGLYDLERAQGAVYYAGVGNEPDKVLDDFVFKQRDEAALLKEFWEGAKEYDTFVTFSGRAFDVPFMLHRSIAHRIKPSRELMKYRYLSQQSAPFHIDLQDELTWYRAMSKRPGLHLFCRAYGIKSSKCEGVTGEDVTSLFNDKKFFDIARYNSLGVIAIKELYEVWLQNLAPRSFLDTIDFL